MTDPLFQQLFVGAILFTLGVIGFVTRRNLIVMMLSAELMLHGVSVNLTAFGAAHGNASGQVFTIFVLTIAACEAGLSLSLILALYQRRKSLDVSLWNRLSEDDLARWPVETVAALPVELQHGPRLTPAGVRPQAPSGPLTESVALAQATSPVVSAAPIPLVPAAPVPLPTSSATATANSATVNPATIKTVAKS